MQSDFDNIRRVYTIRIIVRRQGSRVIPVRTGQSREETDAETVRTIISMSGYLHHIEAVRRRNGEG